jgi:hypothetical protein
MSFDFPPEQQLGNNSGYLIFIAAFRHYFQLRAKPRLVPQVPSFFGEMLVQARAIRSCRDSAASQAQLHRRVGSTCATIGKLFAQPTENDIAKIVVAEKLEPLGLFGIAAVEGPQRSATPRESK